MAAKTYTRVKIAISGTVAMGAMSGSLSEVASSAKGQSTAGGPLRTVPTPGNSPNAAILRPWASVTESARPETFEATRNTAPTPALAPPISAIWRSNSLPTR